MMKKSVAYITNNIAPFRIDLLDELTNHSFDVNLCYFQDIDEGVNPNYVKRRPKKAKCVCLSEVGMLQRIRFIKKHDIVVFDGYSGTNKIMLILFMIFLKKRYYISIDGIVLKNSKILLIKQFLKKVLLTHSECIFSTNEKTDAIVKTISRKIKIKRHTFTTLHENDFDFIGKVDKKSIQKKYKINCDKKVILFVGKFLKTKGMKELLGSINKEYDYILVGGDYEELKSFCDTIPSNVSCIKFLEKREILELMCVCDVFVLPTYTDVWGLVIIEALSCGVPIVTTNMCNAGLEFISDGVNGFIIPIMDSKKLAICIKKALKIDKSSVLEYDKLLMSDYTIEASAKDMCDEFIKGDNSE